MYPPGRLALPVLLTGLVHLPCAGPKEADYSEFEKYQSLSTYRSEFASELGVKNAPATAVPAPAVADE